MLPALLLDEVSGPVEAHLPGRPCCHDSLCDGATVGCLRLWSLSKICGSTVPNITNLTKDGSKTGSRKIGKDY